MLMDDRDDTFESTRARLEEIAEEVKSDDITLDEALALYEEAVNLGLAACDLSEQDILAADAAADDAAEKTDGTAAADAADEKTDGTAADDAAAEAAESHDAPAPAAAEASDPSASPADAAPTGDAKKEAS